MLFLPQAKIEQLEAETNLDTLVKGWSLVGEKSSIKVIGTSKFIGEFF